PDAIHPIESIPQVCGSQSRSAFDLQPMPRSIHPIPRAFTAALALVAVAANPSFARAQDDKQVCLSSYEQGQRLRQQDKLTAAREQLLLCGRDSCPSLIKKDCLQWLSEVDASMPSIIFVARGPDGREVVDVRVLVDGTPVSKRLDGKAVVVDPGEHTLRYEIAGASPVESQLIVAQGEKNRRVEISLPVRPSTPNITARAPNPGP